MKRKATRNLVARGFNKDINSRIFLNLIRIRYYNIAQYIINEKKNIGKMHC